MIAALAATGGLLLAPLLDRVAARLVAAGPGAGCRRSRFVGMAVATGTVLAATAVRFAGSWALPAYLVLGTGLVLLSVIDLESYLLPNVVVVPLALGTLALLTLATVLDGAGGALGRAVVAAAVIGGVFGVLHLLTPDGLAAGDVKLAAICGAATGWLGWGESALSIVIAFVAGAAVAGALVLTGRRSRKDPLPFGPFLAVGALVAILAGDALLEWYGQA